MVSWSKSSSKVLRRRTLLLGRKKWNFIELEAGSVPRCPDLGPALPRLLVLHQHLLRACEEDASLPALSLRQLLRIARRCDGAPERLHSASSKALLTDLMPSFAADKVRRLFDKARIVPQGASFGPAVVSTNGEALCSASVGFAR